MAGRRKCSVPTCLHRNHKNNEDKRSMFAFPKDTRLQSWITNIGGGFQHKSSNQYVCELHFEPQFIRRSLDHKTNTIRGRLTSDAVPTIFYNNYTTINELPSSSYFCNSINQQLHEAFYVGENNQLPKSVFNHSGKNQLPEASFNHSINNQLLEASYNSSISDFQVSNISINNNSISSNDQIHTPSAETSLQEAVGDLLSSEPLLMKIKQEQLVDEMLPKVKEENSDEIKKEINANLMGLTAFEQLEFNSAKVEKELPELWILTRLPLGNDQVFAFTKECTVNENGALVNVYEKSLVLNRNGDVTYSIHGKTLTINPSYTPSILTDMDSLLDIILKFNELKVCQGIHTTEFEVDKECTIYKDDLGCNRHVECTLVTDREQCNACLVYSQYLYDVVVNNAAILNERPVYSCNRFF